MLTKSVLAFLVGGFFCLVAQILIDRTKLTPAKILVSYVIFGIFLDAVGIYKPLFELSGCGASLPLIGFGATVATGVREAIDSGGIIGVLKGPLTAMSAGATLALLLGFSASLFFRGRPKRM
jgi:stage V sporulation protein AE